MFNINTNNNIIKMVRGDSLKTKIYIDTSDSVLYPNVRPLADDEKLYFALMRYNQSFECAEVKKVFTNQSEHDEYGNVYLKLTPRDTEFLEPGKYFYTIRLRKVDAQTGEETVDTLCTDTEFWIL